MLSELLLPEEKRSLLAAGSVEDALRQLEASPYGAEIAQAREGARLLPVERALEHSLVDAYTRLIRTLDGAPRALLEEMLRRLELDNLKAILRGLAAGADPEAIRRVLVPLGGFSRLPVDGLLAAESLAEAGRALGRLPYARPLQDALERGERERSLFPLEVALDLDYYRRLWARVQALPPVDRGGAARFLGQRYDVVNVGWLLRYRAIYHLSAEETFNYTLPHGYRIDDGVIRRAAAAPDLTGLLAELPEPYRGLLQGLTQAGIWRMEVALQRYLWREARSALILYPLQIGLLLAYLYLKEAEIHDLRAILEGRRIGRSPEEIAAFLWGEV